MNLASTSARKASKRRSKASPSRLISSPSSKPSTEVSGLSLIPRGIITTEPFSVTEAATRLRRAIYHHTFRLGTLAFRALGPTEAVGVSTRHLEAVNDGLLAWVTVAVREPIKFGLLLLFALAVNFWIALAFLLFAFLVWMMGGQVAAYFRRKGRAAAHRAAEQLALLQESLMLMRLVKVYLMEAFNQARVAAFEAGEVPAGSG